MGFLVGPMPLPGDVERDVDPVGLVVESFEQARDYLELGTSPSGYVIIRTAADVPARLGGLALLTDAELDPKLRDALVRALGIHGAGVVTASSALGAEEQ
jgi:hypothetical protein